LQALVAIGWPLVRLGEHIDGVSPTYVARLLGSDQVHTHTADAVKVTYLRLWDADPLHHGITLAAVNRAKKGAARKGWLPPMAWDGDLDDPDATACAAPRPCKGDEDERHAERAALKEDVRLLTVRGYTCVQIAERVGLAERTVVRWRVANGWKAAA
jgi:hypothetical protein